VRKRGVSIATVADIVVAVANFVGVVVATVIVAVVVAGAMGFHRSVLGVCFCATFFLLFFHFLW